VASCVWSYHRSSRSLTSTYQATVYRALDPKDATPLPIAIKKARVSQRIQRPHLRHEARLLRALEGHPAIPRLVAYGHLQHFEYLAMELLGKSLEQIAPKNGMDERTVAKIAVHLVSYE
jgi:serine/threonine protein kinase